MSMSDDESLHALAFLYLTFGHATDGALTGDEMRAVAGKLREWAPDASLEQIGEVLKKTVGDYKALPSKAEKLAAATNAAAALKAHATTDELTQVLTDLKGIATADGAITAEEESFIAATAKMFGLDP